MSVSVPLAGVLGQVISGKGSSAHGGAVTIFVDRDGVINVNRPRHVKSWLEFDFLPGALEGLALLSRSGFQVVVVTNQSIVNRGIISRADLERLHERMATIITAHGGRIDAILVCPHVPEEGCTCRKPEAGLLLAAREQLDVDLGQSILIGDHVNDLKAAEQAGCASILVLSGRGRADELPDTCVAVLPDLLSAAKLLVGAGQRLPVRPNGAS